MASSYVNDLRLNEMATGDASGTWGTVTNTNLELIGEALGFGTEAITTNADTHTSTVADGATDPVRAMFVKYTGTLDSSCTITIAPNTLNRMHFIENGTSGGQNIIISQGSGANVTIPPGDTKAVYLNGAGSGAAVIDAFASLSVIDLKVQDDLTFTSDSAVITFGSDNDTTLTHTDGSGLTLNGTNKLMFNDASQFIQGASATVLDIAATDTIELTATNIAVVGTMGATGKITADAGIDIDNINIDGTTIALSSGDLLLDVAGDINLDTDAGEINLKDGGTLFGLVINSSSDLVIQSAVQDKDLIFKGNDGGAVISALTLDMSNAGAASFSGNIFVPDNKVVSLGAGGDIALSSNGTNGTIAAPNGDLTIDVAGDLIIDVDGQEVFLKDAGTHFGGFKNVSSDFVIKSVVSDKDMIFQGNDGGSGFTALTLDMSNQGNAIFNNDIDQPNVNSFIKGAGHNIIQTDANTTYFYGGVNGVQFRTADNAAENITFSNTGASVFNEQGNDADFRVESNGNANMLVVNGGTDSVQIGTNIDLITGAAVLTVNGQIEIATAAGTQCLDMVRGDAGLLQNFRKQGGSSVGNITISASATAFNTSSDYRLKENVVTSWDATTRLKKLKPSRFNFIIDADTTVDGFLAHEVSSIVPEAVTGTKDATEDITNVVLNADGTIYTQAVSEEKWIEGKSDGTYASDTTWVASKTIPDLQSIDQAKLVPLLTKTILELEARITALEGA